MQMISFDFTHTHPIDAVHLQSFLNFFLSRSVLPTLQVEAPSLISQTMFIRMDIYTMNRHASRIADPISKNTSLYLNQFASIEPCLDFPEASTSWPACRHLHVHIARRRRGGHRRRRRSCELLDGHLRARAPITRHIHHSSWSGECRGRRFLRNLPRECIVGLQRAPVTNWLHGRQRLEREHGQLLKPACRRRRRVVVRGRHAVFFVVVIRAGLSIWRRSVVVLSLRGRRPPTTQAQGKASQHAGGSFSRLALHLLFGGGAHRLFLVFARRAIPGHLSQVLHPVGGPSTRAVVAALGGPLEQTTCGHSMLKSGLHNLPDLHGLAFPFRRRNTQGHQRMRCGHAKAGCSRAAAPVAEGLAVPVRLVALGLRAAATCGARRALPTLPSGRVRINAEVHG